MSMLNVWDILWYVLVWTMLFFNPFPHTNAFRRLCTDSFLEAWRQENKLLKTSNYSLLSPCFQLYSNIVLLPHTDILWYRQHLKILRDFFFAFLTTNLQQKTLSTSIFYFLTISMSESTMIELNWRKTRRSYSLCASSYKHLPQSIIKEFDSFLVLPATHNLYPPFQNQPLRKKIIVSINERKLYYCDLYKISKCLYKKV